MRAELIDGKIWANHLVATIWPVGGVYYILCNTLYCGTASMENFL
jgi:hypothetical protein